MRVGTTSGMGSTGRLAIWPETTINYTMIYYIATMAIALWSMSLGY